MSLIGQARCLEAFTPAELCARCARSWGARRLQGGGELYGPERLLRNSLAGGKFSASPSQLRAQMGTAAERSADRVVLVVEDDAAVRQYMVRVLGDAGFHVVATHDGKEAMGLLTRLGPSVVWLVVSDIAMPRVTGVELAAAVSRQWPRLPVLLVSGVPPAEWNGPFLAKPFTPETLVAAVRDLLPPAEEPADKPRRWTAPTEDEIPPPKIP
jgi:CheY-like chemotaxis protein